MKLGFFKSSYVKCGVPGANSGTTSQSESSGSSPHGIDIASIVGGHRGSNSCVAKSAKIVSVKSGKRELEKGL
jgi:hypothetical protein